MKKNYLTFLVLAVFVSFCSKEENDNQSSTNTSPEEAATALALQSATPTAAANMLTTAIKSFETAVESGVGSLAIELRSASDRDTVNLVDSTVTPASKWCSDKADPLADPDSSFKSLIGDTRVNPSINQLSATSPKYGARKFHCLMKVTDASESIQGSIAVPKGVICELEKQGLVNLTENETKSGTFNLENSTCFSAKMLENFKKDGMTKLSLTVQSTITKSDSKWQKDIVITGNEIGKYQIKMFQSDTKLAMLVIEGTDSKLYRQAVTSFTLSKDGTLQLEQKDYRMDSENGDNRFSRALRFYGKGSMKVEGTGTDLTANFSSFTEMQGIHVDSYPLPDDKTQIASAIATIRGSKEQGFLSKTYVCNKEGSHSSSAYCDATKGSSSYLDPSKGVNTCLPSSKSCAGIEPITLGSNVEFLMLPMKLSELSKSPKSFAQQLESPLNFNSIDFSFQQLPQ